MEAIEQAPALSGLPPDELETAFFTLWLACQFSGRREHWRPLVDALARLPEAPPAAASLGRIHHDLGSVTDDMLRRLDEDIARLKGQTDADVVIRTALVAEYFDRVPDCREAVLRVIRDGGAVGASMPGLMFIAVDDMYASQWQASADAAAELIALCGETGYHLFAQVGHYVAAMAGVAHRLTRQTQSPTQSRAPALPAGAPLCAPLHGRCRGERQPPRHSPTGVRPSDPRRLLLTYAQPSRVR